MKCPAIDHGFVVSREMIPSGWGQPHAAWECKHCGKFFHDDGTEGDKPEAIHLPKGLLKEEEDKGAWGYR